MIFLGLGSSIGEAEAIFASAEKFLIQNEIKVIQKSSIFKNPPLGDSAQNEFSNAVWQVEMKILKDEERMAMNLLQICKQCEATHGRDFEAERWSDRPLDIDILMFHDLILDQKDLKLPHREIAHRDFVLLPWQELVDFDFVVPGLGKLHNLAKSVERR